MEELHAQEARIHPTRQLVPAAHFDLAVDRMIERRPFHVLVAELEGQRALVIALRAQLDLLEGQISAIEDGKRTERERADEWKDRAMRLEAELQTMRTHQGLPWWRKMLTTTAPPAPVPAK